MSFADVDDPRVRVGLERLETGAASVREAIRLADRLALPGEPERRAREGLATLRSALDWLEDSEYFERAHRALDHAGGRIRTRFGCQLTFEPTKGYSQTCPVALAHTRVGMSAAMIVHEAECSICGNDPEDCEHVTGRRYDAAVCVRVITKAELLEVSLVSRPNQPDARIHGMSISRAELKAALGGSFRYGTRVSCDRCLGDCQGLTEVPSVHA